MNSIVIAIIGPTASGKTSLSLELASAVPCEIISADSRQVFRYLDIGTAKPTPSEQSIVPHHCVDILNPDEKYSAGQFAHDARPIINTLFSQNKVPIIVGGSGLYCKALCEGLGTIDIECTEENRAKAMTLFESLGREGLYEFVQTIDAKSAEKYADKNPQRLLRVIEYYFSTGLKLSDFHGTFMEKPEFTTLYFGIEHERNSLYEKINSRCTMMWENGIFEETESVLSMGYKPDAQSLQTVGYKEVLKVLSGELSKKEGLEAMQQSTRRYAKRQLTWCNNQTSVQWLDREKAVTAIIEQYTQALS